MRGLGWHRSISVHSASSVTVALDEHDAEVVVIGVSQGR
jgi:hypothetical protein